jgi:hypothetical protein
VGPQTLPLQNDQLQANVVIPPDSWATIFGPIAFQPGYWLMEFSVTAMSNTPGALTLVFAQTAASAAQSMGSVGVYVPGSNYNCGGFLSKAWGVAAGTSPSLYCNIWNQSAGSVTIYALDPLTSAVRATSYHAIQISNNPAVP